MGKGTPPLEDAPFPREKTLEDGEFRLDGGGSHYASALDDIATLRSQTNGVACITASGDDDIGIAADLQAVILQTEDLGGVIGDHIEGLFNLIGQAQLEYS